MLVMGLIVLRPSFGAEDSSHASERNFSLQQGHGLPICEAYLELLNQTKFTVTPFCGRPEEGPVKGFEHLEGHYMSLEEISPLFTPVWEFMRFGDQHHVERFFYPTIDPKVSHWSTNATDEGTIGQFLSFGWMYVWIYARPIDINNDGSALNVITWQGYGATGTGSQCGSDYSTGTWDDSYINQRAFVLTKDGKAIDEDQTRLIFGAPPGAVRRKDVQLPGPDLTAGPHAFRPLADSIRLFKYEGRYYIETEDRPENKDSDLPPVHVLLREHGSSRQVCTLRPESVPVPYD